MENVFKHRRQWRRKVLKKDEWRKARDLGDDTIVTKGLLLSPRSHGLPQWGLSANWQSPGKGLGQSRPEVEAISLCACLLNVSMCKLKRSVESRNYKVAELIVEGGRIEVPKAPKGAGCGRGCPPPHGEGSVPLPRKFLGILHIKWHKMLQFGAYSQDFTSSVIALYCARIFVQTVLSNSVNV